MGAFLYPPKYLNQFVPSQTEQHMGHRDFEICFNTISSVCGSASNKMWPLSAVNGIRVEITLEDPAGCLTYTAFPPRDDPLYKLYEVSSVDTQTNLPEGIITRKTGDWFGKQVYFYHKTGSNDAVKQSVLDYWKNSKGMTDADIYDGRFTTEDLKRVCENGKDVLSTPWRPIDLRYKCRTLPADIISKIRYEVLDPVYQMSTVVVPPAIDMQIRNQGQQMSPDGRIRLQNTSWQQFSTTIKWDESYISYTIPVHVASLKSLFFTITPNNNSQNMNCDRSQFIMRNLNSYNFKLNGENILSSNCRVQYPYSESIAELLRAWSISLKDGGMPTMLTLDAYADNEKVVSGILQHPTDAIFAVDLEAFGSRAGVLDSGINVRNSSLMFEANFNQGTERNKVEWGERQTITFYALYDMYVSIDAATGMISYEN